MSPLDSQNDYLLTAFLPEEERRELEVRAAGQPGPMAEIAASFRLRDAIRAGSRLDSVELEDAMIVFGRLAGRADEGWRARLQRRIEADSRSDDGGERQLPDLEGDAGAHFQKITGHHPDGPAQPRWIWLTAAAVAALILVHGFYSRAQEDALARAVWGSYKEAPTYREAAIPASDLELVRSMAQASRHSVLGLWPSYDLEALDQALARLAGRDDPSALLERARLEILLGRVTEAQATLEGVSDHGFAAREKSELTEMIKRHLNRERP